MLKISSNKIGAVLLFAAGAAFGQTPAAPLAFEVASVKLATPDQAKIMAGQQHIGLKVEGNRVDIGISTLSELLAMAYKVKYFQVQGPSWLGPMSERFDIQAKMPAGATKDDVPQMIQALLAERFKLAFHRTTKDSQVYAMEVAKGGVKMKEAAPDVPVTPEPNGETPPADNNMKVSGTMEKGMTVSNTPVGTQKVTMVDGVMHVEASKMPMAMLSEALSRYVDHPVVDMTELKGNYQVVLDISQEDIRNVMRSLGVAGAPGASADTASEPGSSILTSVQQLGLKLEARKLPLEMIVIDHLEKLPTEN